MKKLLAIAVTILFSGSFIACSNSDTQPDEINTQHQKQADAPVISQKSVLLKGKDLAGAELTGFDEQGRTQRLKIQDVGIDPKDPEKEIYLYTVLYQDSTNYQWKNLCKPDAENVAKAIPLSGEWDETGAYIASEAVTFGCTNGVLAKCVRFGYKPWKNVNGKPMRDYHQACTRMLRADYCGIGKGHTRNGTLVDVYDVRGIQKKTNNSEMVFEAGWGPDGATFVNRARWFETLPEIRQECPAKLKNRINEGSDSVTVEQVRQKFPETLLFNDSLVRSNISYSRSRFGGISKPNP